MGANLVAMLHAREVDAVIVGNDVPEDARVRTVFADPVAAGVAFRARYGFMPVNHLVAVSSAFAAEQPGGVAGFVEGLLAGGWPAELPVGRAALGPAVAVAIRFAEGQGLLSRGLSVDDVWEGLPDAVDRLTGQG